MYSGVIHVAGTLLFFEVVLVVYNIHVNNGTTYIFIFPEDKATPRRLQYSCSAVAGPDMPVAQPPSKCIVFVGWLFYCFFADG
jgi:hypothetical protein